MNPPQVKLDIRPQCDEDEPLIRALKAETDSERLMLDLAGLLEEEKASILESQFQAHQKHYRDANWEKTNCVVQFNGEFAGFFIVFQDKEEIRLADLAVKGTYRGMGIGYAVVQSIQNEAIQSKRPLRLHVEKLNPAVQFYEQLGFQHLEDRVTHFFLEWLPPNMQGKKLYFPGE